MPTIASWSTDPDSLLGEGRFTSIKWIIGDKPTSRYRSVDALEKMGLCSS